MLKAFLCFCRRNGLLQEASSILLGFLHAPLFCWKFNSQLPPGRTDTHAIQRPQSPVDSLCHLVSVDCRRGQIFFVYTDCATYCSNSGEHSSIPNCLSNAFWLKITELIQLNRYILFIFWLVSIFLFNTYIHIIIKYQVFQIICIVARHFVSHFFEFCLTPKKYGRQLLFLLIL